MSKRFQLFDLKAAAYGRWHEIHAALGIPHKLLSSRHQPCPYCGGKDRFRYTNHQGNGGFICNQCTPEGGSGFDLLMLVFGYDFKTAAQQVAAVLGISGDMPSNAPKIADKAPTPAKPRTDNIKRLTAIWGASQPMQRGDPVHQYLQGRGLEIAELPTMLHYSPYLPYWHNGALIGHFPAMLAAISNTNGELMGLHQTYLKAHYSKPYGENGLHQPESLHKLVLPNFPDAPAKKMKSRYAGALKGAAVHLAPPDEQGRLIVAEGIETALAARAMFGLPAIAALSAWGMGALAIPPAVSELFIVADNDTNLAGYKAAHRLAVKAIQAGIKANIWQPQTIGFDALDEYNQRKELNHD